MKVTLTIPDDVYETYERHSAGLPEKALVAQLLKFKDIPPSERTLVIWGADRLKLEGIMQTTVESPKRLFDFLRNCGSVKIGPVERPFSPDEMIRIGDQAKFHGWTPDQYMRYTVDQALDYIFDRI